MLVYIITFLFSLAMFKLANTNSKYSKIFSILGVLLPCLVAAFRSLSIGTDVQVYINLLFQTALKSNSFSSYANLVSNVSDIGYLLLTYLCSRITSNISLLFFFLELLTILPIYIALKRVYGKNNAVIWGMFLFFMFFFNQSLNMARQSIAISFFILAITYLEENKRKKYFLFSLIGYLFHSSCIVSIPIYLLYRYLNSEKDRTIFKIMVTCILIALVFFLPNAFYLAYKFGIVSAGKYYLYVSQYMRESIDISYINIIIYTFVFIYVILNKNNIKNVFTNTKFFQFCAFISIIILQFGSIIKYSDRIGYYLFYPILFLVLPSTLNYKKDKKTKNEFSKRLFIFIVFTIYWLYWIVILKYNATYPYISIFD